jgi:uncharacterized membrane protein YoaK (UPF0700 family)
MSGHVQQERDALPASLVALAGVGGYVDAVTYLALGHVFTANMTGNTVLLAIAAGEGDAVRAARSLCAIAGFVAGAALAAVVLAPSRGSAWPRRTSAALGLESACLLAIVLIAWAGSTAGHGGELLTGLSGVAMGTQSALVWLARSSGASTTYITGTLTGMIVRAMADPPARSGDARVVVPAAVWAGYFAAALLGVGAAGAWGAYAIGWPALVLVPLALAVARGRA